MINATITMPSGIDSGYGSKKVSLPRLCDVPKSQILIVDHRDNVYFAISTKLRSLGLFVDRAISSFEVNQAVERLVPDLVLVSEIQRTESCWLIAAKLGFCKCPVPVWVYSSTPSREHAVWQSLLGVKIVLHPVDTLSELCVQVCSQIRFLQPPSDGSRLSNISANQIE